MKKMMTKTNGKYTYEDLLLRKRLLKQEIREIEKIATLEHLPQTLGMVGGSLKEKTVSLIKNPATLSLLIDAGLGLGGERIVSKFINKKSIVGKAVLMASTYLIPLAVNKTKEFIEKRVSKKEQSKIIDITEDQENEKPSLD